MIAPEGPSRPGVPPGPVLTHTRHLGASLYFHSLVRLVVGLLIVGGAFVARWVVGVEDLDVPALVGLGTAILGYGAATLLVTRGRRGTDPSPEARRFLRRVTLAAIVLDYLALTVAIWIVGGTRSPFLPFFLLHVILSCFLLPRRPAIVMHFTGYGLLALLVIGEWSGFLPSHSGVAAITGSGPLDGRYALTVLVVYGFLFLLTAFLMLRLARVLREGERQVRAACEQLARLSEMRRDFLHIALHNIQAPVGAATMFLRNLRAKLAGPLTERQDQWLERSLERLGGLDEFMHDLRLLSRLEAGELEGEKAEVDVGRLLASAVEEHHETAEARSQQLTLDLAEPLPRIRGVRFLLKQAVANYITNAVKYTPAGGHIEVRASPAPGTVRIVVADDGPGISPADQARLFGEFVRVGPAGEDRTGGFGLGLSIVRRIAELHGGRAWVESEVGSGSRFGIDLPADDSTGPGDSSNISG